ncbi:hypothetical protein BCV70DRAFT_204130 [Testicularia cyperi]|uniref:Uncharacterized protein n=1 Tax=Testicularia cyperi TaxID=1882483 RepID=A0A317XZV3_9BASI|nr:hypothetical protein BCV70DRAFT_204130 [Testicularia cyperi]
MTSKVPNGLLYSDISPKKAETGRSHGQRTKKEHTQRQVAGTKPWRAQTAETYERVEESASEHPSENNLTWQQKDMLEQRSLGRTSIASQAPLLPAIRVTKQGIFRVNGKELRLNSGNVPSSRSSRTTLGRKTTGKRRQRSMSDLPEWFLYESEQSDVCSTDRNSCASRLRRSARLSGFSEESDASMTTQGQDGASDWSAEPATLAYAGPQFCQSPLPHTLPKPTFIHRRTRSSVAAVAA